MRELNPSLILERIDLGEVAQGYVDLDGRGWARCPFHKEATPSFHVRAQEQRWKCFGCGQGGDVIDLVSQLEGLSFTETLRRLAAQAGIEAGTGQRSRSRPWPAPAKLPSRLPPDLVARVWSELGPVLDDAEATAWLRSRSLDPSLVEDLNLARVVRKGQRLPAAFALGRKSWAETGHRLVLPMFGATGELEGLHARALRPSRQKTLNPLGGSPRGLVFAEGLALQMFKGLTDPGELLVLEGLPDYLSWATRWGMDQGLEQAPAVMGIVSGSWTPGLAARVPDGTKVLLRVHGDRAGRKYGDEICESLADRCRVLRLKGAA